MSANINDTIVAQASGMGPAGVGVIRLSGPRVPFIAEYNTPQKMDQ